jgi:hypothetical protein
MPRSVEHPLRSGLYDAVLFERNSDATTGRATHVSLVSAGEPLPNAAGNLVAADAETIGLFVSWDGPPISITLENDAALAVQRVPGARKTTTRTSSLEATC